MPHTEDTFFLKLSPLCTTWQVNTTWLSHSLSVMARVLVTLKVVGLDPVASVSTLSVVTPDSTCFPSRSQNTEIFFGLKPVAWQMSLDVRWLLLEKASRGGMKTLTLGDTGVDTGAKEYMSAWLGPTLAHLAEGRRLRLTWEWHFHVLVTIGMTDFAHHEFIRVLEDIGRWQEHLGGGCVFVLSPD